MTYRLMSRERVLGRTGVELPPPAPRMRSWQFVAAPAFAEVRPLFAALPAAIEDSQEAIPTQGELEAIPEAERETHMRELLRTDVRMARFIALSEQLDALELALVDAAGEPLNAATIGVTELEIGADAFRDILTSVDASANVSALAPPFYLVVAGMAG
jgi:hypothetical protein